MVRSDIAIVPAGAGAGKTYRIETGLLDWIKQGIVRPDRIVAVTFTEAAAQEMRMRIRQALLTAGRIDDALALDRSYISTIHSFGMRLLRDQAFAAGISPAPRALTDDEKDLLLRLEIAHSDRLALVLADLKHFDYTFDARSGRTAEQEFRETVSGVVNRLCALGECGADPRLVEPARAWIANLYGSTTDTMAAAAALHRAAANLRAEYPDSMADCATSDTGRKAFRADHAAVFVAATAPARLASDWRLWKRLRSLRKNVRGDTVPSRYNELAATVVAVADELPRLAGPLEDAQRHAEALVAGAQDMLGRYTRTKRELGVLDFADMVADAEALLRKQPHVCEAFAQRVDCMIVDEFQDTNPIQFALLWHLIACGARTLIVGDLKQAIMRFQAADARLMQALLACDYVRSEPLSTNWRSAPAIMTFINGIGAGLFPDYQALEPQRVSRPYPSVEAIALAERPPRGSGVSMVELCASHIAVRIHELLGDPTLFVYDKHLDGDRHLEPRDIAVLCRTNDGLAAYAAQLRAYGLKVRIDASGWLLTEEVQVLLHAVSYVVDQTDRHAALHLATSSIGKVPLECALRSLAERGRIDLPLFDRLAALAPEVQWLSVDSIVARLIAELSLYDWALSTGNPAQTRANLVRFEASARDFVGADRETLAAAGIYGHGVETFAAWLEHRAQAVDMDNQPATSNSGDAIELVTWHKAKGREWPVVIVSQLRNEVQTRLPSLEIGYDQFEDLEHVLEHAQLHYAPRFTADEQCALFKGVLLDDELLDAKRLLYVALTRAREKLILEWPGYLFNKKSSSTAVRYATILRNDCDLQIDQHSTYCAGTPLRMHVTYVATGSPAEKPAVTSAPMPSQVGYGRVAIVPSSIPGALTPDRVSPSTLERAPGTLPGKGVAIYRYADPLLLPPGLFPDAAAQGTALHRCLRTLLARPELADRLFDMLPVRLPTEVRRAICRSAEGLRALLEQREVSITGLEVPVLAMRPDGAVISGVIDLVGRSPGGILILDHKSDAVQEPVGPAARYQAQLAAYISALGAVDPTQPVHQAGINWLSLGMVALFDATCFIEVPPHYALVDASR